MNWFEQQRQAWIAETLMVFGYVQRRHIMRKFGVSMPQASADLQKFLKLRPGVMRYDVNEKRYIVA